MVKTILFDVDGVFLSEERCFDATALSIWELVHNPLYLGLSGDTFTVSPTEENIRRIREHVLSNDAILQFVKDRGINSNWDMVFLTFSHQLVRLLYELSLERREFVESILQRPIDKDRLREIGKACKESNISFIPNYDEFVRDFQQTDVEQQDLLLYVNDLARHWLGIDDDLFPINNPLWELGRKVYQEWYLGDPYYEQSERERPYTLGKNGFLEDEIALANVEDIRSFLSDLREKGYLLGIGTSRPYLECKIPFQRLGFWEYFHPEHVVTATDVSEAERKFPNQVPLGKPKPFTYVKGYKGRKVADEKVLSIPLPIHKGEDVLIIGDSVADYMAAQSMGCKIAAILTCCLSGKASRSMFEALNADYIFDDVLQLREILL